MPAVRNERIEHICASIREELGRAGLAKLLRRIGVDPGDNDSPDISGMQEATLLREACREADDISFAAQIGATFRQATTLPAYMARSSANLREAIERGAKYYGISDASTGFRLTEQDGHEAVEVLTPEGALLRHHRFQEFRVFGLLARLRAIAGADITPEALSLRHEIGQEAKPFDRLAGCPVRFGANFNGITFRPGTLDLPLATHDPELVAHLSDLAAARFRSSGAADQSTRAKVEAILIRELPGRILSADEVATELGFTRRTLSRRLKQDGVSFRDIVEQVRHDLAKTYLRDGLSISDIAFYLGYSDHAAFSTAFRRWEGQSPRDYRHSA